MNRQGESDWPEASGTEMNTFGDSCEPQSQFVTSTAYISEMFAHLSVNYGDWLSQLSVASICWKLFVSEMLAKNSLFEFLSSPDIFYTPM